jgi:DNA-3-methyladenine glycosylase II
VTARPAAPLTERSLRAGVATLARREARFASIVARHGPPPLWAREPGFATLVLVILEQQVSLASARATFDRLRTALGTVTPAGVLALDDAALRGVGFSRQKARYARLLADACLAGALRLERLARLDDAAVERELCAVTGIGPWTAQVYALMVLRRPDVFPAGDLALVTAVQRLWRMRARPDRDRVLALAEAWRPLRAVAARLLWHHYLSAAR